MLDGELCSLCGGKTHPPGLPGVLECRNELARAVGQLYDANEFLRNEVHALRLENGHLRDHFRTALQEEFGKEMQAAAKEVEQVTAHLSRTIDVLQEILDENPIDLVSGSTDYRKAQKREAAWRTKIASAIKNAPEDDP